MKLQKTPDYNNLSEEFYANLPEFKPGQTRVFKVAGLRPDPNNKGRWICPYERRIPTTGFAYDPGTNEYVSIAPVKSRVEVRPGEFTTTFYEDEITFFRTSGGTVVLQGENPVHQMLFAYMWAVGYNIDQPNRLPGTKGMYNFEDVEKESKILLAKTEQHGAAISALSSLIANDEDVREFASGKGWSYNSDINSLRAKIIEFVNKQPGEFLKMTNDPTLKIRAVVNRAFQAGILSIDESTNTVKWASTGQEIFSYPKTISVVDKVEQTVKFILNKKEGQPFHGELVRQLGGSVDTASVDIEITDSALELATEMGIDLASVIGSGAGGKILKKDVEAAIGG